MDEKKFIQVLGFLPEENATGIFQKHYQGYAITVDFGQRQFDFGSKIKSESTTTQNFGQAENWVVLECVDRLLEKGYAPEDITLEKTFKVGHGNSGGRLDILVEKEGKAFLMIECKTYGKAFQKALATTHKNGGQLLSYFQNDTNAQYLMLYASTLEAAEVKTQQAIIKIEDHYRDAGNVVDVFERWNKITLTNGIFEDWVAPYHFENKRILIKELVELDKAASTALFHSFLSILRKHSVSDKPNAFNVIFDLFLAKLWDEKKEEHEEADFQWRENEDDAVSFQYRLLDLYRSGMDTFLSIEVFGLNDNDFCTKDETALKRIRKKVLMLEKVFNIKSVINEDSFQENHRVLKEIVEMLQGYKIRYPRKQQHLSDFFERLLTTGLKQEAGQFFTPPPITRFVIKSLPIRQLLTKSINQKKPSLPAMIDYAAGSGHFLTEIMEEYQSIINTMDISNFKTDAKKTVQSWRINEYDWAKEYIYGVDKDYRLVKVAKVGCYFYGDGLAQVIHGDGLDNFAHSKTFRGKVKANAHKPQFQLVLSNPPYSVSAFKTTLNSKYAKEDFDLFDRLTDRSSEIECLFVERTKHLLSTDGIGVLILPSSILSNTGIYTQTREIILKSFEIVAITELGSATFMATGTNTVTLFLKRRDDQVAQEIEHSLTLFFSNYQDITIQGIERAIAKYVAHVWEEIDFADYQTLLQGAPNENIQKHEIYKDYQKKIKVKKGTDKWAEIRQLEREKLLYFILAYKQRVVLVKTGQKSAEKRFLGYEFSNRRGNEGMHPIQRSKTIDECTQLYDVHDSTNAHKASFYIYQAFSEGRFDLDIPDNLKSNVSYQHLVDMLTFDRVDFEKNISLSVKKKAKIESRWKSSKIGYLTTLMKRGKSPKYGQSNLQIIKSGQARGYYKFDFEKRYYASPSYQIDERKLQKGDLLLNSSGVGTAGRVTAFHLDGDYVADSHITILRFDEKLVHPKYALNIFGMIGFKNLEKLALGQSGQIEMTLDTIANIKIPIPPLDIQQKIVEEIAVLEQEEEQMMQEVERLRGEIEIIIKSISSARIDRLGNNTVLVTKGSSPTWQNIAYTDEKEVLFITSENVRKGYLDFSKKKYLESKFNEIQRRSVLKKGDFLINIVGASIGRAAIYNLDDIANINQAVALVRCANTLDVKFLNYFLNSDDAIASYTEMKKEVARANLSLQNIKDIKIPLPLLNTQQKIVTQIEAIETKIQTLEQQIASTPQRRATVLKMYL
ncbi:MAG: restriction endonuclease subunit S [Bacteroidota bacterium]